MARFAVKTAPQRTTWEGMLDVWRTADEIELFESAWNFDHLYPLHGDVSDPCLEAWVTLSALAQATSRLRLGAMVTGMHFRHPAVTASMAASLDIVSGGRLILGLGAGWFEEEAEAFGIDLGTIGDRMTRFEEGIEVIHRLLTQKTTSFDGEYFHLKDAYCEPKPVQSPRPPIAIGGRGEKRTLRVVAEYASIWDAQRYDPGTWPHLREVLEGHCEQVGRDSSEITSSAHLYVASDFDQGEIAERAAAMFDLGIDLVILGLRPPHEAKTVERLAEALSDVD